MKKVSPWSVKGVEPEAREAAKIAARRAGLTVGQWLNQTIRAAAADQLTTAPASPAPASVSTAPAGQPHPYGHGFSGLQPGDPAYRATPPATTDDFVVQNLLALTNRIERSEKQAEATVVPLISKVEKLSGQVEQVCKQVAQVQSQTVTSAGPVERAMQRLSERIEKIEASRNTDADGQRLSFFGRNN